MFESLAAAKRRLAHGEPPPAEAGIFGATIDPKEAKLVLLPVPWDVTASYGKGAAKGPRAIVAASHQLDLEDLFYGAVYEEGIAWDESLGRKISALNQRGYGEIESGERDRVNATSEELNAAVKAAAQSHLSAGRIVGVVGGEHSAPFGLLAALAEHHDDFGILHVDAHFDLRQAYEGYRHSHASIMYNVLTELPQVTRLTQVAIRDFSKDEKLFAASQTPRQQTFFDLDLAREKLAGKPFGKLADEIVATLPSLVYVSFDIDGLDPALCPTTGTPVPGGLSFAEACYLLEELQRQGKKVIGFDLCEVAPSLEGEWDANVGARLLYKLCGAAIHR